MKTRSNPGLPGWKIRTVIALFLLTALAGMAPAQDERRLSLPDYQDRMKGGWVGQMAGVCWGGPTEFKWVDEIIPPGDVPVWRPEMINDAFGQDDLYVEMTFLRTLESRGLGVSRREAGIDFANSEYRLWCANEAGRTNLRRGIAPPDSSHPRFNTRPNDIDYQIEADFAGLISPGLPNAVIGFGNTFGRLMNYGDGLYGGQFMGGMYAAAFFERDIGKVIAAGLACIPADSQYAGMVRDLVQWHRENPGDWEATWARCQKKYREDPAYQKASNGGIDVKINGAYVLLGLLYGDGDMDRTIQIAMRAGLDSDCNPSSAGGVLGAMLGYSRLPARFSEKLNPSLVFSYTAYTFPQLLAASEKLARQNVVRQGGRIDVDAAGHEVFVIPRQTAKSNPLELSWAPGPVAGVRFTPEEYARIRFRPHPADVAGDDPTQRVQGAIDVLFPGWRTSPNGPDQRPGYRADYEGRDHVVMTQPLAGETAVVLSRRLEVPKSASPRLRVTVANAYQSGLVLVAKIDGHEVQRTTVEGRKAVWRTLEIELAPFAGRGVTVELVAQAQSGTSAAAFWGAIDLEP